MRILSSVLLAASALAACALAAAQPAAETGAASAPVTPALPASMAPAYPPAQPSPLGAVAPIVVAPLPAPPVASWTDGRPQTPGALALSPIAALAPPTPPALLPVAQMHLPPGFKAEVWASGIPDARELALGEHGTVFVSSALDPGAVYALVDQGGQRQITTVASQLVVPNGIDFTGGALYVATTQAILRFDAIETQLDHPPAPAVVGGGLPDAPMHRARVLRVGPDGRLYLSIGAPCNSCEPGPDSARIVRMNPDGSDPRTLARGVRNAMGMDFSPVTGDLWFTDNGRDWLSENMPNDTLNHLAPGGNANFGFPYCDQGDFPDPVWGWGHDCSAYHQPAQLLGPHAGVLGLRFYTGTMFPPHYRGAMFVARHGPWNRTQKFGADIVAVWPDAAGGVSRMEPFMSGWVQNNQYLGRPVDLLVLPDGSLLVSDDYNGAIYRISYAGP